MSAVSGLSLLLLVPAVPLLLAIPALRRRLPWPLPLALLPAMIWLFSPGRLSLELPWVLLGGGALAIDEISRWWLAMSVAAWGAASIILFSRGSDEHHGGTRATWLLLAMAGQLGSVVAADLVTFIAFSSFMGYAFFGLMVFSTNAEAQRAGRIYLVLLVVADIILFEALLIAGGSADDFGYTRLAEDAPVSPGANLSLALAFCGFALKVAIWPIYARLPSAFASSRPALGLCLWIAPVATGLLGILRWMPVGEIASHPAAGFFQVAGGAGLVPALIVGFGLGLTVLTLAREWPGRSRAGTAHAAAPDIHAASWFERAVEALLQRLWQLALVNLPALRTSMFDRLNKMLQWQKWQDKLDTGEQFFGGWALAMLLAVVLSMLFIVIGLLSSGG